MGRWIVKYLERKWLVVLFVMAIGSASAQSFELPDTNFRNRLQAFYPWLMNNGKLNTRAAESYNGALLLNNANISDASGLEYFINIKSLNLSNNQLETIPALSKLTKLTTLYLISNKLKELPDLSELKDMTGFQVQYNQLGALPYLNHFTKLEEFYCNNNQITHFPSIDNCKELRYIVAGDNPFERLPDFSPFKQLRELHVHQTGADTIVGIEELTRLEAFYAWSNKLKYLPDLSQLSSLRLFYVFDNQLTSFPALPENVNLIGGSVINNYLTLEDLLPYSDRPYFSKIDYAPQLPWQSYPKIRAREKDQLTLEPPFDRGLENTTYTWYHGDRELKSDLEDAYSIASASSKNIGLYKVSMSNSALPDLVIESHVVWLDVLACLSVNNLQVDVLEQSCESGAFIDLRRSDIQGGKAPFLYSVQGDAGKTRTSADRLAFDAVFPDTYLFRVEDSQGCSASGSFTLASPRDCDPVFTPNGDGYMDTYRIEETGVVKIYDTRRRVVKEFTAPGSWDGSRQDGSPADAGYYAIVINNTKIIHLTLIR